MATLHNLVCHVVLMRTREQVQGIAARRVVTAMKDLKPVWNRAVCQLIGNPMGSGLFSFPVKRAVYTIGKAARPLPTVALRPLPWFGINFTPKVLCRIFARLRALDGAVASGLARRPKGKQRVARFALAGYLFRGSHDCIVPCGGLAL